MKDPSSGFLRRSYFRSGTPFQHGVPGKFQKKCKRGRRMEHSGFTGFFLLALGKGVWRPFLVGDLPTLTAMTVVNGPTHSSVIGIHGWRVHCLNVLLSRLKCYNIKILDCFSHYVMINTWVNLVPERKKSTYGMTHTILQY